ncbi:MAG: flagellar motor protein [Gammaproteobacteria bacterium]
MDPLSLIGLALAVAAILAGQKLEGGSVSALINGPALLIVAGGTIGAAMVQSPPTTFLRAVRMLVWIVRPPVPPMVQTMEQIVEWGRIARKDGLLGLENVVERADDRFARKGLQLLVDGNEPGGIRTTLEMEIDAREQVELQAARVFDGMGGYAPTIGIIGAVMGLIQVMSNLTDPSQLGGGIAVAFVATIYGVALANLFLLPAANKLKIIIGAQSRYQEMIAEGIVAIAEGENPRIIEARLQGLLH